MGVTQFWDALERGHWDARSPEFLGQPWVRALEWLRLPGDARFILRGAVPLVWLCVRAARFPTAGRIPAEGEVPSRPSTELGPPAV